MNDDENNKPPQLKELRDIRNPDGFTIEEFIERERATGTKGKQWLYNLMIILVILWAIVKLPHDLFKLIYSLVNTHKTK